MIIKIIKSEKELKEWITQGYEYFFVGPSEKVFENDFEFQTKFVTRGRRVSANITLAMYLYAGLWKKGKTPPPIDLLKELFNYMYKPSAEDPFKYEGSTAHKMTDLWWSIMENYKNNNIVESYYSGVTTWEYILNDPEAFELLSTMLLLPKYNRSSPHQV